MSQAQLDGRHPAKVSSNVDPHAALHARLREHEGERFFVYDDATGKPLKKGDTLQGHPTIGVGRNLAGRGITKAESDEMLSNDLEAISEDCDAAFPWAKEMNAARKSVLLEMVFQIGVAGVKKFVATLRAMREGRYGEAADGMLESLWARQTPKRAARLAEIMRSGAWL
jgi:lysozyme